jgi:hypothetical protein
MKSKLVIVLFFLFGKILGAQDLPDIVPPSPRAETFQIYGDVPVSYNTGVPDISIPLYTIQSDGITIPIVLRYHIGSIKPGRDNSNVAFGWVLDVGGRISRTTNQWPDEYVQRPADFRLTGDLNIEEENDFIYMYQASMVNGPYFDTKYDIFSYSTLGQHGKFIINNQEGNSDITIHELIESPKKINLNMAYIEELYSPSAYTNESIEYFTIKDGIGQTYYYGENNSYESTDSFEWGKLPTSWLLSRVVSADGSNTVDFDYESSGEFSSSYAWTDFISNSKDEEIYLDNIENPNNVDSCVSEEINDSGIYYEEKTIKEINFSEGKILFYLSDDNKRINSFEVLDIYGAVIKSINFSKTYFIDSNYPDQTAYEKLEELKINNHDGTPVTNYKFKYFDYGMPIDSETDYWGYFNGQDNYEYRREIINSRNDTGGVNYTCQSESGDKSASLIYSKSYVLNEIVYPTGGYTQFDYELNEFQDLSDNTKPIIEGGGLRIGVILNYDENGTVKNTRTYEYTPRTFAKETPKSPLNPYNYIKTNYYLNGYSISDLETGYARYRSRVFSHGFNGGLLDTDINYENVTEYFGNLNDNVGKVEYTYEYGLENTYWNRNLVGDDSGYDFGLGDIGLGYNKLIYFRDGVHGKLKTKENFRNNEGIYTSISKTTNTYRFLPVSKLFYNLNVELVCSYSAMANGSSDYYEQYIHRKSRIKTSDLLPILGSYDSYVCQSSANLIKQEVIEYQDTDTPLITTTDYAYNDNGLVTEQSTITSKGETQKTKTIYPDDIETASTVTGGGLIEGGSFKNEAFNAVSSMQEGGLHHQPATPIQIETYKEDKTTETLLSIQRTNFKVWDLNQDNILNDIDDAVLPEFIETSKGANVLEERIVFKDYYENGNVKEVHKTDGDHIVYIWGYNQTQPIAKIENVTYNDIKSYVSNLQSLSDGDNDNCFDTESCNESALRDALATLRANLPDNAMMSSYTYDPLIGVTSTTDSRGYTTYYEYDDFNRLEHVKDANGHIISKREYHYKDQQ